MPTINELQKLVAGDRFAADQFGYSVSMSGDGLTAIVGARYSDNPSSGSGSAYILINSGGIWSEQAKLVASDAATNDYFGRSVSISDDGNTVIVGAYADDSPASNAGSAYIFTRSGTSWSEEAKLVASDAAADDYFGNSVSLSADGNTAIVGAGADDSPLVNAGSAYIFTRSGTSWSEEAKLVSSDQAVNDYFGTSVSISDDGNTVIVGAYWDHSPLSDAGSAYIFTRSGTTWSEEAKLVASDQGVNAYFGYSVSMSGDGLTAIVGAYADDSPAINAGSAYIFTRSGTTWSEEAKLVASDQSGDYFGYLIDISDDGNTVIVGAYADDSPLVDAGSAYIFTRSGTSWSEEAKLVASDQASGDQFGYSVSMSGDATIAIVGAPTSNEPTNDEGSVYIFATGITPPASGVEPAILALSPIGYWKLNDAYNASVLDYSGNGYDGSWVGVTVDESTQDDMLGDGVLGLKVNLAGINDTGFMNNTAVLAFGNADTDSYTWIGWVKGFDKTGCSVMSWYTSVAGSSAKQYRGRILLTSLGELSWNRVYQTGPDPIADVVWQSGTTSGLGLVADTAYLMALRESTTTTEILVNGSVVISFPRVGMSSNDTTYAPRDGLRVGNETTMTAGETYASYVHSAIYDKLLSDSEILGIYSPFTAIDSNPTIGSQQPPQGGVIIATKTGSLNNYASMYGSNQAQQSAYLPSTYTAPDNYIVSNQIPQGVNISAVVYGQPTVLRYSTHGLTTSVSSTPANTPIEARLLNAGNYINELDITQAGTITPSYGQITIDNMDGSLDSLIDKAFDGGSYKLYYGPKNGRFPDDFIKVVDTVMGKPTFDNSSIKIQLKDKIDLLNVPFASHTFQATGGLEGNSTVSGLSKQRIIGKVYGAPVQLLDASKLLYYVSQDSMNSSQLSSNCNFYLSYLSDSYRNTPDDWTWWKVPVEYARVFDGGTQLTNGSDYPYEYDISSLEPTDGVGWLRQSNGAIAVRLLSPPAKDIRVDVKTSPSGSSNWTINDIIGELGGITIASDSTNIVLPTSGGFVVSDPAITYLDVMSEFMKLGLYYAKFTRDGELKVAQIAKPNPAGVAEYEFNYSNTYGISIEQQTPMWKVVVNSGETNPSQVNTGISDIRRDEFTEQPYHTITSREDSSIRSRHKLAGVLTTNTMGWWTNDDISSHFDNVDNILMEESVVLTVTLDRGHLNNTTLLLEIGDQVSVKIPRYNLNLGKNFIIHGVRHDYGAGKLTFTLWG